MIHTLKQVGITPERQREYEDTRQRLAQLRIECLQGILTATTGQTMEGTLTLVPGDSEADVNSSVAALDGSVFVNIPPEG